MVRSAAQTLEPTPRACGDAFVVVMAGGGYQRQPQNALEEPLFVVVVASEGDFGVSPCADGLARNRRPKRMTQTTRENERRE
jgi:hypothetical protein